MNGFVAGAGAADVQRTLNLFVVLAWGARDCRLKRVNGVDDTNADRSLCAAELSIASIVQQ